MLRYLATRAKWHQLSAVTPGAKSALPAPARGYVGDPTAPLLAYLAMTSRMLARPVNVAAIAPSAAGKNAAINAAADLMPEEAIYRFSAGSERSLIYAIGISRSISWCSDRIHRLAIAR